MDAGAKAGNVREIPGTGGETTKSGNASRKHDERLPWTAGRFSCPGSYLTTCQFGFTVVTVCCLL
jgi:hypothetical protein